MITASNISTQLATLQRQQLLPAFDQAARATGINRNLLLAIASRESNMGLALDSNYLGDGGNGMGLMQIDRRWHPTIAATVNPGDHGQMVLEAAYIFKEELNRFDGDTYAALAAYNTGPADVKKALAAGQDPDRYTTGGNYAKDVLRRWELINTQLPAPGFSLSQLSLAGLSPVATVVLLSGLAGTIYVLTKN